MGCHDEPSRFENTEHPSYWWHNLDQNGIIAIPCACVAHASAGQATHAQGCPRKRRAGYASTGRPTQAQGGPRNCESVWRLLMTFIFLILVEKSLQNLLILSLCIIIKSKVYTKDLPASTFNRLTKIKWHNISKRWVCLQDTIHIYDWVYFEYTVTKNEEFVIYILILMI